MIVGDVIRAMGDLCCKICIKTKVITQNVGNINYLKLMKREMLVEICLKSATDNRKEARRQNGYLSGTQKRQTHVRARRTHQLNESF